MLSEPLAAGLLAAAAAFGAGVVNAIAGGGTNLTFPALLWLGVGPIEASATSTVALWPGQTAGAWGYRHETRRAPRVWLWLLAPCFLGGLLGGILLVQTPPLLFRKLAPFLVLGSTVLLALEPGLRRRFKPGHHASGAWRALAVLAVLAISIYGGYFGAGMGIMMLATLGLLGLDDLQVANGLKNLFGSTMNLAAVLYFLTTGAVAWEAMGIMVASAILGGYTGALLGSRIGDRPLRLIMVVVGLGVGLLLLLR